MSDHHDKRLLVQTYLKNHSFNDLAQNHGVYARIHDIARHGQADANDYKASLNYDQIEAKDDDKLAQQCRGLVLRSASALPLTMDSIVGNTVVLARGFDRFFNFGQGSAANVDFSHPDTCFYEKHDGTCISLYWDDVQKKWCVATRSVSEADLPIDGYGEYTFAGLFCAAVNKVTNHSFDYWTREILSDVPTVKPAINYTFVFELMTSLNQIVVKHNVWDVRLLTVRDKNMGLELTPGAVVNVAKALGVRPADRHSFTSVKDVVEFVNSRSGLDYEGIVVCDNLHRRVKMKSAAYLVASRAKTMVGASPRNVLELILQDQIDDVLPLLNETQVEQAEACRVKLRDYLHAFDLKWAEILAEVVSLGPLSDKMKRKAFAQACMRAEIYMSPAMAMYEGKAKNLHGWILSKKNTDGGFSNNFLDSLIDLIE